MTRIFFPGDTETAGKGGGTRIWLLVPFQRDEYCQDDDDDDYDDDDHGGRERERECGDKMPLFFFFLLLLLFPLCGRHENACQVNRARTHAHGEG